MNMWRQKHGISNEFLFSDLKEIARFTKTLALYFFIIMSGGMSVIGTVSATTVTQQQYPTNLYYCYNLGENTCTDMSPSQTETASLSAFAAWCLNNNVTGPDPSSHTGQIVTLGTMLFQSIPSVGKGAYVCMERMDYENGWLWSAYYALPIGNLVCPSNTVLDPTGNFCVTQQNLTITLSGSSEIEPSNGSTINTLPFIATVIDQNTGQPTTNPVNVHISLKVDPTSGGHDHGDSTRPRGGIAEVQTCTSDAECWSNSTANGAVVFNFNPTDASGTHTITATCDGCSNTATANVDVKVDGLWPIPDSGYYALTEDGSSKVIGSTTDHVYNHYLTTAASMKLWRLAADFYNYQIQNGVKTPILLHLNDGSLKWGGIFDLDTDWDEPHAEHRRGIVIDVRANSNPGAIPAADYAAFKQMAKQLKVDPYFEGDSTGQHFHLRLLNKRG
jgi:hypothetical protein